MLNPGRHAAHALIGAQLDHGFGVRVGGDIDIRCPHAHNRVAHGAPYKERLMARIHQRMAERLGPRICQPRHIHRQLHFI